jgi:hypothetical protein
MAAPGNRARAIGVLKQVQFGLPIVDRHGKKQRVPSQQQ